jgi:type IV fimbrial biogenesis protein FimT
MRYTHRGFTLIELLTALTVLAILLGLAVPTFRDVTRNNRIGAAQNDLVTAFTYARSEALRISAPVSVCASADGATCSGSANWATGWIAFIDTGATAGSVDAGEKVMQVWAASNSDMTLTGSTPYVQYGPTGITTPAAAQTFDVYVAGCSGAHLRRVALTAIGSMSSTTQNCP